MTNPIDEKIINKIMESDPMKRMISLEKNSIITGRMPEYKGILIQEVILSALQMVREDEKKHRDDEWVELLKKSHPSVLTQLQGEIALKDKLSLPSIKDDCFDCWDKGEGCTKHGSIK